MKKNEHRLHEISYKPTIWTSLIICSTERNAMLYLDSMTSLEKVQIKFVLLKQLNYNYRSYNYSLALQVPDKLSHSRKAESALT